MTGNCTSQNFFENKILKVLKTWVFNDGESSVAYALVNDSEKNRRLYSIG